MQYRQDLRIAVVPYNTLIYFAYSTGFEMFTQQGTHCTGQSDGPDQRAYSETCPQVVAEHSSQT